MKRGGIQGRDTVGGPCIEVGALPEKPFDHRSMSALDGHDQRWTFGVGLSNCRSCRLGVAAASDAQQDTAPLPEQPPQPKQAIRGSSTSTQASGESSPARPSRRARDGAPGLKREVHGHRAQPVSQGFCRPSLRIVLHHGIRLYCLSGLESKTFAASRRCQSRPSSPSQRPDFARHSNGSTPCRVVRFSSRSL